MKRLNSIDLLYQNFKIYINNDRKKMLALIILNYYVYEKVTYSNSLHKKFILLWNYYKKEIIEGKKKKVIVYALKSLHTKMGFEPIPTLTHHNTADSSYLALLKLGRISFNVPFC